MSEPLAPKLRLLKPHLLSTVVLLVGLTYSTTLEAQTTTADRWETAAGGKMAFDVASVKPDKLSAKPVSNVKLNNARNAYLPNGGVFSARNYTLLDYIAFAYKLSEQQEYILLPGLPDWV